MKRNKIIAVALAVLMMAGALVLASCKDKGCSYGACAVQGASCTDSSCAVVKTNNGEQGGNTCDCD
jgi:hypothetical protein